MALLRELNPLTPYQVDAAVTLFGVIVENALAERVKGLGKNAEEHPRYRLAQLLDPSFKLPRPLPPPKPTMMGIEALRALVGKSGGGVRAYQYVGPPN